MKIEIVFQETNISEGIRKNDTLTYEKLADNITTIENGIKISEDFVENCTNEDMLGNIINGLNHIGVKYKIIKIEL